jgi:8-hydroxy-5-deazaflavin:NADPH oxidoreductase
LRAARVESASGVVILAVPYSVASAVAQSVGDWQGKILVDATNPLAPGLAGLSLGTTTSGAENMADARYPGGAPFMPICDDDADARAKVVSAATPIGFDAVDCGELSAARYLEPFAMTWIHLAIKQGLGRRFAFARLRC